MRYMGESDANSKKNISIPMTIIFLLMLLAALAYLSPKFYNLLITKTIAVDVVTYMGEEIVTNECPYYQYAPDEVEFKSVYVDNQHRKLGIVLFCTLKDKNSSLKNINIAHKELISKATDQKISQITTKNFREVAIKLAYYSLRAPETERDDIKRVLAILDSLANEAKNKEIFWIFVWNDGVMPTEHFHLLPNYQINYS